MTYNYCVVATSGDPRAEFLTVSLLEVLLRGHKDIRRGVEPQKLACPLLGQMVRHNEHGFAAQSKALGLHRGSRHCKGLARTNLVREQGIAAIEDASNGVALVLAKLNFRVHSGKCQVAAIIFSRFGAIEKLVVLGHQRLTAVSVFPQPVLEGVLNDLLFLLRECGFLAVEHTLFVTVFVLDPVENAYIAEIERIFEYLVGVHALCTVGAVGVHVACAHSAFTFDAPLAGHRRIVHLDVLRHPKGRLERLIYELTDVPRLYPRRAEAHVDLAGGQVTRLRGT